MYQMAEIFNGRVIGVVSSSPMKLTDLGVKFGFVHSHFCVKKFMGTLIRPIIILNLRI